MSDKIIFASLEERKGFEERGWSDKDKGRRVFETQEEGEKGQEEYGGRTFQMKLSNAKGERWRNVSEV